MSTSREEWAVRYDEDGHISECRDEADARAMAARITSEPVSVVRRIITVGQWKSEE